MPMVTDYVALPFTRREDGGLAPGQAVDCPSLAAALREREASLFGCSDQQRWGWNASQIIGPVVELKCLLRKSIAFLRNSSIDSSGDWLLHQSCPCGPTDPGNHLRFRESCAICGKSDAIRQHDTNRRCFVTF